MTINEYLRMAKRDMYGLRPRVHCQDGFSFSVQASDHHYCSPRINDASSYKTVEIGYPSKPDELLYDYAEDITWTDTVYGHVPVRIVDMLIRKHGGIVNI
jgi:hypothetical protein